MIKKITLITILLLGNIAFSQEPKLTDKYLFATLKGKIDDKHDITMNIHISDVNSLSKGTTTELTGNYHYDRFGENIYFTKGTINKNSIIIEADNGGIFKFKLDEATLNNILELKNSAKNITINGTLEGNFKSFSCVINSIAPLGGKLSEVYKYNISGEASYDVYIEYLKEFKEVRYGYDEDAFYSPSMKLSYFYTNIEKLDIDTFKNTMKENLKEGISNVGPYDSYLTNDLRIGYFDNKILCAEEYMEFGVETTSYYYTIISLETGKRLSNDFYEDLVDYSEELKEFLRKEFYSDDYHLPKPKQSDDNYYQPYFFIFNNDETIDICNEVDFQYGGFAKIEMEKLKPYIKKDSFYRYLFD